MGPNWERGTKGGREGKDEAGLRDQGEDWASL